MTLTTTMLSDLPKVISAEPTITIYGPEVCPKCTQAMRHFDGKDVVYTKIAITPGDPNYIYVNEELGCQSAPVVVVEFADRTTYWSGHRPDMLFGLTRLLEKAAASV